MEPRKKARAFLVLLFEEISLISHLADKALILERAYGEIAPKIGKIISDRLVSPVRAI